MVEKISVNLRKFIEENIATTFIWIQNPEFRKLFSLRGEPNWDTHVNYFKAKILDSTQKVFAIYAKLTKTSRAATALAVS